jgi:hypothetical protein
MAQYSGNAAPSASERASVDQQGSTQALAVSYPALLEAVERLTAQLEKVLRHLEEITGDNSE